MHFDDVALLANMALDRLREASIPDSGQACSLASFRRFLDRLRLPADADIGAIQAVQSRIQNLEDQFLADLRKRQSTRTLSRTASDASMASIGPGSGPRRQPGTSPDMQPNAGSRPTGSFGELFDDDRSPYGPGDRDRDTLPTPRRRDPFPPRLSVARDDDGAGPAGGTGAGEGPVLRSPPVQESVTTPQLQAHFPGPRPFSRSACVSNRGRMV